MLPVPWKTNHHADTGVAARSGPARPCSTVIPATGVIGETVIRRPWTSQVHECYRSNLTASFSEHDHLVMSGELPRSGVDTCRSDAYSEFAGDSPIGSDATLATTIKRAKAVLADDAFAAHRR